MAIGPSERLAPGISPEAHSRLPNRLRVNITYAEPKTREETLEIIAEYMERYEMTQKIRETLNKFFK